VPVPTLFGNVFRPVQKGRQDEQLENDGVEHRHGSVRSQALPAWFLPGPLGREALYQEEQRKTAEEEGKL